MIPGILEKIKQLKKEQHLTNSTLAQKADIPVGTLNKILNGETVNPKLHTIQAIASALDCSLDDLMRAGSNTQHKTQHALHALPKVSGIDETGAFREQFSDADTLKIIRELAQLPEESVGELKTIFEYLDFKYNRNSKSDAY